MDLEDYSSQVFGILCLLASLFLLLKAKKPMKPFEVGLVPPETLLIFSVMLFIFGCAIVAYGMGLHIDNAPFGFRRFN